MKCLTFDRITDSGVERLIAAAGGLRLLVGLFVGSVALSAQFSAATPSVANCTHVDAAVSYTECGMMPHVTDKRLGNRTPAPTVDPFPEQVSAGPKPSREATVSLARLKNAPPPKALREVDKANAALADGDRKKAIRHLLKAIKIHPNFIEARNNLGVQYMRQKQYEDAMEQFERTLELDPTSTKTYVNLAVALHSMGQLADAQSAAQRALELDPNSPEGHMALSAVLLDMGPRERAIPSLLEAARTFPQAHLLAADLLIETGRYDEAQDELRRFMRSTGGIGD